MTGVFTKAKMLLQQAIRPVVRVLQWTTKEQAEQRRRRFIVRRALRRQGRMARRAALRAAPRYVGYQCPRCWKWFGTPEERAEHRISAHRPVHAPEVVAP